MDGANARRRPRRSCSLGEPAGAAQGPEGALARCYPGGNSSERGGALAKAPDIPPLLPRPVLCLTWLTMPTPSATGFAWALLDPEADAKPTCPAPLATGANEAPEEPTPRARRRVAA